MPSARRGTSCSLIRAGGDRILIDCGEGAQRQMMRSTGLLAIDDIYITHLHADHYLGLPGLLKTYDLNDRVEPLRIFGPKGVGDLFEGLRRIFGRVGYPVEVNTLASGDSNGYEGYEISPFEVSHSVPALGYALVEADRPGHFDPERARELGVSDVREFGRLQRGETVAGSNGDVAPGEVMGEARRGRKLVMSGDTVPCEMTRLAAHQAQLLVHEASFSDEDAERASETGHSTARGAAELAREAEVELLALVHISSRYYVRDVLDQAREVHPATVAPRDFDLIEIPFPERGEPKLVDGGAKAEQPPNVPQ